VKFRYDDLAQDKDGSCEGELLAVATNDPSKIAELDGLVSGRVTQAETTESLQSANALFSRGDAGGARAILRAQSARSSKRKRAAARNIPKGRRGDFDSAFDRSAGVLGGAASGFKEDAKPAAGEMQAKQNQAEAFDLSE